MSDGIRDKIVTILEQQLDNPCNWCVHVGMSGECMIDPFTHCNYDINDEVYGEIADMIISILPTCTKKPWYQPTKTEAFQNSIYWKIVHISEQKNVEWVYQKEVIQTALDSLEAIEGIRYHPLRIVNGIRGLERRKLIKTKKNGQGEIMVKII